MVRSAAGESEIKDELSEAVTLSGVTVMVGEWIPFGSNQIVSLNDKLGSADRCQVSTAGPLIITTYYST